MLETSTKPAPHKGQCRFAAKGKCFFAHTDEEVKTAKEHFLRKAALKALGKPANGGNAQATSSVAQKAGAIGAKSLPSELAQTIVNYEMALKLRSKSAVLIPQAQNLWYRRTKSPNGWSTVRSR